MKKALFNFIAVFILGVSLFYTGCNVDACKDVDCGTGGDCVLGDCACKAGYSGTKCDVMWSTQYVGSYSATETCDSTGLDTYTMEITASSTDATKLNIMNLYGAGEVVSATLITETTFDIATQPFGLSSINGDGSIASDGTDVSIDYSITFTDGSVYVCTVSGDAL